MAAALLPGKIWFGAAYYWEYPVLGEEPNLAQLRDDLDLMKRTGVSLIRVGESVWSTWEPGDGNFSLDWLEPVLDEAAERGIDVILGTPTYAIPMWLAKKDPSIAGDVATGQRLGWGQRQEMDFTNPTFRWHAERIIRAVIGRYAHHPAVVGVQVDNEPGLRVLYNDGIFDRFVDSLRTEYGTVERLNKEWSLVYWSHLINDWSELWRPDNNAQPQYDLAWRRFQADIVAEYIAWQAGIVREVLGEAGATKFVTTCISYDQDAVDDVAISRSLDLPAANVYYAMQGDLAHPSVAPMTHHWTISGTWSVYHLADLAWSSQQGPFLVTETNAAAIGQGAFASPGYDGQWRQIAWLLVSRGARSIQYWHWKTLHYGAETFWGGVIGHDGMPGRVHAEIAKIGAELERAGASVTGLAPDADVAFLFSSDAKWALGFRFAAPLLNVDGGASADSYRRLALPFYRGAFDAGLQVNTVRPDQVFSGSESAADFAARRPVLVVAGYYVAADADLHWLDEYVAAGGHLILGPRSGYADTRGRARTSHKPSGFDVAGGATYQESETLKRALPVSGNLAVVGNLDVLGDLAQSGPWAATEWLDYLEPDDAEVIARIDDANRGRWAAATTRAHGDGRVTIVATVPNGAMAADLMRWAVSSPVAAWPGLPASVRVTSARSDEGATTLFLHHWGDGEVALGAPYSLRDVLGGGQIAAGETITLGPWDVRVLAPISTADVRE
jgi:beta-galactosidase